MNVRSVEIAVLAVFIVESDSVYNKCEMKFMIIIYGC
jgi:hypothetical protein